MIVASVLLSFAYVLLGYLMGSVLFGVILGRLAKKDPREFASKSAGATNTARVLGKKAGIFVAVLDAAKAILAITIAYFATRYGAVPRWDVPPWIIYFAGMGCIIGHAYPLFFHFKGGKGVAVSGGIIIAVSPIIAAIGLTQWAAVIFLLGYVSIASTLTVLLCALWVLIPRLDYFFFLHQYPGTWTNQFPVMLILLGCAVLVFVLHWPNWKRLVVGKERVAGWSLVKLLSKEENKG